MDMTNLRTPNQWETWKPAMVKTVKVSKENYKRHIKINAKLAHTLMKVTVSKYTKLRILLSSIALGDP